MVMMLLLGDDDELMMTAFLVRASSPRATSTSALSSHLRSLRHASSERDALAWVRNYSIAHASAFPWTLRDRSLSVACATLPPLGRGPGIAHAR